MLARLEYGLLPQADLILLEKVVLDGRGAIPIAELRPEIRTKSDPDAEHLHTVFRDCKLLIDNGNLALCDRSDARMQEREIYK